MYNAVWYENDLEIITGATALTLNGRIHTNGNLLVGVTENAGNMTLRQVSSKTSCFYNQENGQITVGGNVGNGSLGQTSVKGVTVDLYRGYGEAISSAEISSTNRSTDSNGGALIGFNDAAFNQRIAAMKISALALCTTCNSATTTTNFKTAVAAATYYPADVRSNVAQKVQDTDTLDDAKKTLSTEIELYLKQRTRRVPFAEVSDVTGSTTFAGFNTTDGLEVPQSWREPINSSNQLTGITPAITLATQQLNAVFPTFQKKRGIQFYLGDRVFIGNNLPAKWKQADGKYVGLEANQYIKNSSGTAIKWTEPPTPEPQQDESRWRNTQIQSIADLGISERGKFWEQKAAENPANPLDSVGGVRIVTGAGIYVDGSGASNLTTGPFYGRQDYSFLPIPNAADNTVVWPDTMPMSSPTSTFKGDLLMRATAVYHFKIESGIAQTPVACVSSYFDPTDATTAKNRVNIDGGYGIDTANGRSNNGVVYDYPSNGRSTFFNTYKTRLVRQGNLKYPNGRWVNKPLKDALDKIGSGSSVPNTGLEFAHYSAIDTALCAISILAGASPATTLTNKPPHGAIKEASFVDGREVKQISPLDTSTSTSTTDTTTTYDLDLEQRQPLEVRVTDIDLGLLARTPIIQSGSTTDYFLPYSGIIYATRDDGLRDESTPGSESQLLSPTDFRLDPTRRPNGIRLINGATLARDPSTNQNKYEPKEKGLILATDLPAYIKGAFNIHRTSTTSTTEIEEFTQTETGTPSTPFYDRSTPETKFACRINRTGCSNVVGEGDYWRPATIIADAMTLLSNTFQEGFRSQGDYDLNNNTGIPLESNLVPSNLNNLSSTNLTTVLPAGLDTRRRSRLKNGFWENNYVTSANWWQTTGNKNFPLANSGSYLMNGVTPIQRRIDSNPMYVMEMCRQEVIEQCTPDNWVVGFDINGNGNLNDTVSGIIEKDVKANQLGKAIAIAKANSSLGGADNIVNNTESGGWDTQFTSSNSSGNKSIRQRLGAGDTGSTALVATDRRYPRRVAFARNATNQLVETSSGVYKPIGVGCPLDTTGTAFNNNGCTYTTGTRNPGEHYGITGDSALLFRTTSSGTNPSTNPTINNNQSLFYYPPIDADGNGSSDLDGQPLLVPVLQIHDANATFSSGQVSLRQDQTTALQEDFRTKWTQVATTNTTFNATFVVGNSPSRPSEVSSGLQNFVRFLENWRNIDVKISGSFIQLTRSAFATAPLAPIFTARQSTNNNATATDNLSIFDFLVDSYPTPNVNGISPFYTPPNRRWGFDVGLLSEQPDLFAQRFTTPPTSRPNEFFREVGRDDPWVQALLCAGKASNVTGIVGGTTPTVSYSRAVSPEYYSNSCESVPNN